MATSTGCSLPAVGRSCLATTGRARSARPAASAPTGSASDAGAGRGPAPAPRAPRAPPPRARSGFIGRDDRRAVPRLPVGFGRERRFDGSLALDLVKYQVNLALGEPRGAQLALPGDGIERAGNPAGDHPGLDRGPP